jgi:hypothetical protein
MVGIVQAKFTCTSKKEVPDGFVIEMIPVVSGSPENERYFKYTPFGKIEMGTINRDASDSFIVGTSYYVCFSPANGCAPENKEAV